MLSTGDAQEGRGYYVAILPGFGPFLISSPCLQEVGGGLAIFELLHMRALGTAKKAGVG